MRVIFVGAGPLTVMATRRLLKLGHDVVIIEQDSDRINTLSEELDCGFIHGDGSRPAVLEELSPDKKDMLFCLSSNDQDNIIASLVGETMNF
jgi:trk system potassium uptake protein TrkA